MAGVKRRPDAAHSSATPSANNTAAVHNTPKEPTGNDSPSTRVTRNLRSSRDARAGQNDDAKIANPAPSRGASIQNNNTNDNTSNTTNKHDNNRPSRVITLKYGPGKASLNPATPSAAAATTSVGSNTRETRNSRARAAASATPAAPAAQSISSRYDGTPFASAAPETPRTKRVKRGSVAEETPRSTRQSTRLKSNAHEMPTENGVADTSAASKPFETSPLNSVASNTRTRNRNRQTGDSGTNVSTRSRPSTSAVKSPSAEDANSEAVDAPYPMDVDTFHDTEPTPPAEGSPKGTVSSGQPNKIEGYGAPQIEGDLKPISTRSSPILSRKRKSLESDDRGAVLSTSSSPSKKPKLEDATLDRASEPALHNGDERRLEDTLSQPDDVATSKADEGSRQITEEAEDSTTPDNATESTIAKATRGGRTRGRGRGARSRTSARFGVNRRGRGGTRAARSGRTGRQNDRSSDIEFERSPSPSAATQKLRDRQRELDKAFRRVAAAQRLALAVLATQSEKRLARDKNAHKAVPEYEDIMLKLGAQLRKQQDTLRREYDLKVAQENRIFQANKEAIEERCRISARNIQEEHLLTSHGEYMTFIEGRRAAEDDEHTETDGSETENERGRRAPVTREIYRGFNSSFVRDPAGAASYERAALGWDDFVQRAKLGDDINPQMKEIRDAGPFAGLSGSEIINLLLEATGIVEVRDGVAVKEHHPSSFVDVRPTALTALADVATAEIPRPALSQHTPRLAPHRAILPQPPQPPPHHAHPEPPRPFVLPPPTPRGQPRRLLPAGQQIPPISEPLGLPDPFSPRGGPPQLPPPPGSNFQRPPLPGYLTGHHHPGIYYAPPPPPRPPY
ncbi:hypothetical protein ASPVEDRAFT_88214 [Aspergillus versicolor CBS 583.65]|uniref:Uncharacterized protein n=1 Tax=Aspergillus versicolor CBS 583.65 TaxID=1036611 RepID=A0A1L9PZR6_ASPVE|nr:uncharacterized protein ASPVEDRAFT_88214 [Aspergillus versicolor CBS 583.65]OJJ06946.1 hypothetical protein ASPVEDRAFT_88214 [Aspergillus versicolor CBS 583.65]